MKAISAPRTGVDAADRAERGSGPFATLGPPDLPSPSLPAQGGEGGRVRWPNAVLASSLASPICPKTFRSFNCEPRVDPQHLIKLSRLGIGGRQHKMRPLLVGRAQCAFAEQTDRLPVAFEHVIDVALLTKPIEVLKRIEADVCLQYLEIGSGRPESRSRISAQDDKWSFCLTAGTLCAANRERQ
jgi:hypothetical protein